MAFFLYIYTKIFPAKNTLPISKILITVLTRLCPTTTALFMVKKQIIGILLFTMWASLLSLSTIFLMF